MKKILGILVIAIMAAMAMPAQGGDNVLRLPQPPQLQISADETGGEFYSVKFFQIKGCKDYFQSFRVYQPDENYLFRNQMRMQLIIFIVRTDTKREFSIGFYPKGLVLNFLLF